MGRRLKLHSTAPLPITSVSTTVGDHQSTVVQGQITLTWPYNKFKQAIAFGVADPNNRAGGYVRLQFRGPVAQAVTSSRPKAGDNVLLCLDGADIKLVDGTWNVTLTKKVLLQVSFGFSLKYRLPILADRD